MNEREFHEKADKVFLAIEQWVEEIDKDIDIESQEGILTLTLPQGNQVLLSCQTALNELWLASKLGAFHFT
jgi:CyaY protein